MKEDNANCKSTLSYACIHYDSVTILAFDGSLYACQFQLLAMVSKFTTKEITEVFVVELLDPTYGHEKKTKKYKWQTAVSKSFTNNAIAEIHRTTGATGQTLYKKTSLSFNANANPCPQHYRYNATGDGHYSAYPTKLIHFWRRYARKTTFFIFVPGDLDLRPLDLIFAPPVTLVQRYATAKLQVSTAFPFRENKTYIHWNISSSRRKVYWFLFKAYFSM